VLVDRRVIPTIREQIDEHRDRERLLVGSSEFTRARPDSAWWAMIGMNLLLTI
jgi:hypothetical protein